MQQQPSEQLSDFLKRLEKALTKVIQRGGLSIDSANRARVEQLLRGAVASDLMLVNLKLRERKENPPSFLELLSEIRSEEEYEASRAKLNFTVHKIQAKAEVESKQTEIQTLKTELKELKAMFASMAATIQSLKKAKIRDLLLSEPKASTTDCSVKRSAVYIQKHRHLPEGLVGPTSFISLKVNQHECDALLDSGSQVTIIFEAWYKQHLSDVPIHPVTGLAI